MKIHDAPKHSETTEEGQIDEKDSPFMVLMRTRFDRSVENEAKERKEGLGDIRFINGDQWTDTVKTQRGKNRLCITINKLPASLDQIDGDIRLNTPGIKVKAVDDAADKDTATVIEGLIRYVQRTSRAPKIHSYAGLHAAAGGRGAWRVITKFVNDIDVEQTIEVVRIIDAYSVYYDSGAERDDKQDGFYFFLITLMEKDVYIENFGGKPVDFENDGTEYQNWATKDKVVVAEYFYKEKVGTKTIYLLNDDEGTIVDEKPKDGHYAKKRDIHQYKIMWAKVDGKRVLEREEVAGPMFPIILTWGKQLCVDGKLESRGIAKHAKDACMLYNYSRSNNAESSAMQPKQPFLMPDVCMTDEFRKIWDRANDENLPYLPFHVSRKFPNAKPKRETPAMASSANREEIMISDGEIRDTVGIQKAALGKESNETSGVAIARRKQESDTGQFAYVDNLGEGIVTECKIILGMIPIIFDTKTQIRILGKDMKEKTVTINDGGKFDLTVGRYDIDISIEGSYSTQREEFQEKIALILPMIPPEQVAMFSDILFEMQDFHRADDIAQRIKKILPPGILETEDDLDEDSDLTGPGGVDEEGNPIEPGGTIPPEPGMEGFAGEPVDPTQEAATEQAAIETETKQVRLEQEQVRLEGMRLDNDNKKKLTKDDIMALVNQIIAERSKIE